MSKESNTRREFLQTAAVGGVGLGVLGSGAAGQPGVELTVTAEPAVERAGRSLNILMLGGTRFLGPHTVRYALARGHSVTLFNRGRSNADLFPELEKIKGNRDPQIDEGLSGLEGREFDAVIDTSANIPRWVKASGDLLGDRIGQYLFVSSICAHANWTSTVNGTEDSPLDTLEDPTTENVGQHYCAMKAECERTAHATMTGKVTVVRPGLIVGPDDGSDRFTYWPVRVRQGGEILAAGDGLDPSAWLDVRDLGAFLITLLENRDMRDFNAAGPNHPADMAEMLYGCKAVTGGDASFTWIDDTEFLAAQQVRGWVEMPIWMPRQDPEQAGANTWNNARAQAAGLSCRPLAETVRDTLAYWDSLSEERRGRLRAGIRGEKEREVLDAWRNR